MTDSYVWEGEASMINKDLGCAELRPLIIIGTGGAASNIVNVAFALEYQVHGFIHQGKTGQTLHGRPVFSDLEEVASANSFAYCIALGNNFQREKFLVEVWSRFPDLVFPTLIHPSCSVGPGASVGEGSVVMPHSVIGTDVRIESFCLLGNQSCVGHDSHLHDFASLGPAATLAGNVTLGRRSAIGLGAKVRERISIGEDSILGASSFLNDDLGDNLVAFGIPARVTRLRQNSEEYLN